MAANGTPMREVLGGYAEPSVWLVLTAMLMARVLMDTGLAHRIALLFIRQFGARSLGVGYALVLTDVTLAAGVPIDHGAVGQYGHARRQIDRGAFRIDAGPDGGAARHVSVRDDVPGLCGRLRDVHDRPGEQHSGRLYRDEADQRAGHVEHVADGGDRAGRAVVPGRPLGGLPRAAPGDPAHARGGGVRARPSWREWAGSARDEAIALAVFAGVGLLWITSGWHGLDVTFVAMAGLGTLLLTGTLAWKKVGGESAGWEVFIWYGGLLRMGELLNNTGITKVFAEQVGALFTGFPWMVVLLLTLVVFFYAHYFFASITAHMLAMLPPFVVLLVGGRRSSPTCGVQPAVPGQPDRGPHALRHDDGADPLQPELRVVRRLVARRVRRVGRPTC